MFQAFYLKLIIIKRIVSLPGIKYKKHYILNIKRVIKEEKGKRLKRGG